VERSREDRWTRGSHVAQRPAEEDVSAAQGKGRRERVLPLGDPGDRLDVDRMDGEQAGREERTRDVEEREQSPEEDRGDRMEQDVVHVVAEGCQAPQVVLDPERRVGQRVVLRRGVESRPDGDQAGNVAQRRVVTDVRAVVPHVRRVRDRQVGGDRQRGKKCSAPQEPRPHAPFPRRRSQIDLTRRPAL